ncbi:hypothetical protein GCM10010987_55780 [Bradyrhizobium guangdongense]|uniref:Uncharacterized protein n=1 Tax=Bradyrhizobium guangdongense TaxID=1325090 RepID=A0AA87W802_9BRAD|nr:hypothetical protein GCM10010987_55780 [Bradyrhizobium guangdongense]
MGLASGFPGRYAAGHGLHDLQDGAPVITEYVAIPHRDRLREGGGRNAIDRLDEVRRGHAAPDIHE